MVRASGPGAGESYGRGGGTFRYPVHVAFLPVHVIAARMEMEKGFPLVPEPTAMIASLRPAQGLALQQLEGPVAPAAHLRVTHTVARTGTENRTTPTPMTVIPATTVGKQERCASAAMDIASYNQAVDDHSDKLYRYVVKHLRDRDEAKDIVQECYLRLWMRLERVAVAGARSYLYTTAHNLLVDRSRRRKYLTRYEGWHDDVRTAHQPAAGLRDSIDGALAKLSPLHRSLVLLRDLEGHSYSEIAAITGLELTKVKVYLFRARKAIQGHLGELSGLV